MVAPIVSVGAAKGLSEAIRPLQADLLVIRGKTRPKRKGRVPTDYEIHVNPLGLGLAAVGAGLTLWLMQLRMQPVVKEEVVQIPEKGHWHTQTTAVATGTGTIQGRGYSPGAIEYVENRTWVVDEPAKTVTVKKKSFSIEQRQPFLNGGGGMELGGPFGKGAPGLWKMLTDPWGVFPW